MNPPVDYLVRRRYEQRISIRKVAKRSGMTCEEVREVEDGDPTVSMLQRYARAVGEVVLFDVRPSTPAPPSVKDAFHAWVRLQVSNNP